MPLIISFLRPASFSGSTKSRDAHPGKASPDIAFLFFTIFIRPIELS